jgi:flagellar L-ring protein FlgH
MTLKNYRSFLTIFLIAALLCGSVASATSLWNVKSVNLFSNNKAMRIGDIVTVIVVEDASASSQSQTKLTKESEISANGTAAGALDFIPLFSGKVDYTKDQQGKGQTSLGGKMSARVTAEVVEIHPNGNLVIEGSRMVEINEDVDQITIRGVIRPQDIASDNTVLSTYMSDAQVSYTGSGPSKQAGRQGLIARLLDLVF